MLSIITALPSHYRPRLYIIGEDDALSLEKVHSFERMTRNSILGEDVSSVFLLLLPLDSKYFDDHYIFE
jgi:hypothetical protein